MAMVVHITGLWATNRYVVVGAGLCNDIRRPVVSEAHGS